MALDLLQRDRLCARQVQSLFELLPKTSQEAGSSSVALGAYCKGGKEGLWEATKQFPKASEALARFVRQASPAFKFSAIMMFRDIKTPMHRDSRNAPLPNLVIPIGDFEGGEIWVEDLLGNFAEVTAAEGNCLGRDLKVAEGPVIFEAFRTFHFTRSWTGDRLILVAYVTEGHEHLPKDDRAWLEGVGFNLPRAGETETGAGALQSRALRKSGASHSSGVGGLPGALYGRVRPMLSNKVEAGRPGRPFAPQIPDLCRGVACTCAKVLARSGGGCKSIVQ